jgi:hypothetical protein
LNPAQERGRGHAEEQLPDGVATDSSRVGIAGLDLLDGADLERAVGDRAAAHEHHERGAEIELRRIVGFAEESFPDSAHLSLGREDRLTLEQLVQRRREWRHDRERLERREIGELWDVDRLWQRHEIEWHRAARGGAQEELRRPLRGDGNGCGRQGQHDDESSAAHAIRLLEQTTGWLFPRESSLAERSDNSARHLRRASAPR